MTQTTLQFTPDSDRAIFEEARTLLLRDRSMKPSDAVIQAAGSYKRGEQAFRAFLTAQQGRDRAKNNIQAMDRAIQQQKPTQAISKSAPPPPAPAGGTFHLS